MTGLLSARGISRSFGALQALDDCSIDLEAGTIAGLIGPNGSGKTTLFNIITGYIRPDAGTVLFNGEDITRARPDRIFELGIGRTFQLTRIFARLTVLENMLIATQHHEGWLRGFVRPSMSEIDRSHAMELLEFMGLAKHEKLRAGDLSFGQRKLLELAYVLVADPAVILLDEPAGGVNLTLINEIAERIRSLNAQGKTFLIVEHNMEFVMNICHKVTVMQRGRAIVSGDPQVVRNDPRVLDAYLGGAEGEFEIESGNSVV